MAACCGATPVNVLPSSANVIWAMIGKLDSARKASIVTVSSASEEYVSRM
jgi:hypothetical protein